jgi:hypothetical protein
MIAVMSSRRSRRRSTSPTTPSVLYGPTALVIEVLLRVAVRYARSRPDLTDALRAGDHRGGLSLSEARRPRLLPGRAARGGGHRRRGHAGAQRCAAPQTVKGPGGRAGAGSAAERTRTSTSVSSRRPERRASASSATAAERVQLSVSRGSCLAANVREHQRDAGPPVDANAGLVAPEFDP